MQEILHEKNTVFIVITTDSWKEIAIKLEEEGLELGKLSDDCQKIAIISFEFRGYFPQTKEFDGFICGKKIGIKDV